MPSTIQPDLEQLTAEVLRLKEQGVGSVPELELFGSGLHRDEEPEWTREEIAAIHKNFADLSTGHTPALPVMIGLDHVEGGPAVGRVTQLWQKPGGVLAVKFDDLPLLWAKAIKQGLWFRVSAEIDPEPPFGLPGAGPTLVGVTLLGAQRPQLKWTSHLQDLVRYAEVRRWSPVRRKYWVSRTNKRTRIFSEGFMDRATLEEQLKTAGLSDAEIEALKALDDTAFMAFANAMLVRLAGVSVAGDGAAVASEGMTAGDMIAKILELDPSQDRAALEAMDEAALKALLIQLGGDGAFAETPVTATTTGATAVTTTTQAVAPVVAPANALTPAQYAETKRMLATIRTEKVEIDRRLKRFDEQQKAREVAESKARHAAEYAEAKATVKRLIEMGKAKPADEDVGDPKSPNWTLIDQILAHDGTRKTCRYAEGDKVEMLTARERFIRTLEEREPMAYGERVKAKVGDTSKKAFYDDIRKQARERYEARNAAPEISVAQRLGMLPPRHQR